jgi:catechol-2,3-dioxygenase
MTNSMCSPRADHMERITMIESISAVTLATHNMPHAVRFYRVLGFEIVHGNDNAAFTSGPSHLKSRV